MTWNELHVGSSWFSSDVGRCEQGDVSALMWRKLLLYDEHVCDPGLFPAGDLIFIFPHYLSVQVSPGLQTEC